MYKVKTYMNPKYGSNLNEAITYDFYNELDTYHGFNTFERCRPFMRDHHLDLDISFTNPTFLSEDNIKINADIYRYIKIRMKNTTKTTNASICWITNEDDIYEDNNKKVDFIVRPYDTSYFEYVIDLSENENWTGVIKQVKFCPLVCHYENVMFEQDDIGLTISIDYIKFDTENINAGAVCYDFKYDCNDWYGENCSLYLNRGILEVDCVSDSNLICSADKLNLDTKKQSYFKIKMKNSTCAMEAVFYYTTDTEPKISADHCIGFPIHAYDKEFTEYCVYIGGIEEPLKQIYIDVAKGGNGLIEIDYIILDTIYHEDIIFDINNDFNVFADCSMNKENEAVVINVLGLNPTIITYDNLKIDARIFKYIKLNMKNKTYSNLAEIYWITSEDTEYDIKKCQKLVVNEMDSENTEYTIGLRQNQYWRGTIQQIKIVPAVQSVKGNVELYSFSVCQDGDTSTQNRQVMEGLLEDSTGYFATGWTFDQRGGRAQGYVKKFCEWIMPSNSTPYNGYTGCFRLECNSEQYKTSIHKEITAQFKGLLQWEMMMQTDNVDADGSQWRLADGESTAIGFMMKGGYICTFEGKKLFKAEAFEWYIIKVIIDLDMQSYTIWVNSEKLFEDLHFDNLVTKIDNVYISTSEGKPVNIWGANRIYKVGYLFDDFYSNTYGSKPFDYDMNGFCEGVKVENRCLAIHYEDKTFIQKKFYKKAYGFIELEVDFMMPKKQDGISFMLSGNDKTCIKLVTSNGNLGYLDLDGNIRLLWENYRANVWYNFIIRVNILTGTASYSVNGQDNGEMAELLQKVTEIDCFSICADTENAGSIFVKKIRVAPFAESTVPYVDKVSSVTGLTGIQAWFAIDNFWQRVNNQYHHSDKDPYLGYYDDFNKETIDWQVKWLAEHGIDFIIPFFYTNLNSAASDGGIRFQETFLKHSKYKDKIKISVCIGEIFQQATHQNVMENVMPFFFEAYFKHPSYLLIDNKPVVFILSWSTMVQHLGSEEALASLFDDMRKACIWEGFDGLIVIGEKRPGLDGNIGNMDMEKRSGLDATFAYCNIYTPDSALKYIETSKECGLAAIPSIGCGWDNRYWCPPGGFFIHNNTPGQFEECLLNIRDKQLKPHDTTATLEQRMLVLDNWSEFGEGHSILPSNLYGFGYLNAVRKALTNADELHYDVMPEGSYNAQQIGATIYDNEEEDIASKSIHPAPWHKN